MRSQQNWAALIATQAGICPYIEGSPGTAKTAVLRALAAATGRRFIQVILRQKMPEDLGGVPVPSDITLGDGSVVRGVQHLLGEDMLRAHHEPSLMLLDEMNQAGHDVLGAAQEFINSPPANCWLVAVGNPVEQSTSGVELAPPVVNRMLVTSWERPNETRRQGWRNGFSGFPAPDVPIVPAGFLEQYGPSWGQMLCDFEDRMPALFGEEAFPKTPGSASQPWPSDRSWTNCGILMAACDSVWANASTRAKCVLGTVGQGAGNSFLQWSNLKDLPDPEELLARPDTLVLPKRFDLVRTILGGCLSAVKGNATPERWERLFDLIEVAYGQQPEVALSIEGQVWKIKPAGHQPRLRQGGAAAEMRQVRLGTSA